MIRLAGICLLIFISGIVVAQEANQKDGAVMVNVAEGWANNSVNAVIFRKNSLVSFKDTQFIAFYSIDRYVMLGKRKLGESKWELKKTTYRGNAADAHNSISIMVDGNGYLHMAWDHHNNILHYCRSVGPGSLELTQEMPMTGDKEQRVSYPEFFRMPGGNLLFLYRDGGSGQGNLVMNSYNVRIQQWTRVQSNLVDGEGKRNAYWQAFVDGKGIIHLSWVWRETPDVASNHDMCYARSADGGKTWTTSAGKKYNLPINEATAEYAWKIPQKSELINQTSMCVDQEGHLYIATYWREPGDSVPQYRIIYKREKKWEVSRVGYRITPFSLSGTGTRRIPVSRPQIICWDKQTVGLVFRDEERASRVTFAIGKSLVRNLWSFVDLTTDAVGSWEPTYDTELWKRKKLHLFVQKVEQVSGEGRANIEPQMVKVLEWEALY
jgi:hypothetical protein